jgi:hypothetical protein
MTSWFCLKSPFIVTLTVMFLGTVGFLELPFASAASPENVWVSTNNTIAEYTPTGTLVTSPISVPNGGCCRIRRMGYFSGVWEALGPDEEGIKRGLC